MAWKPGGKTWFSFALLVAAAMVLFGNWQSTSQKIAAEIARARAAGQPFTLLEIAELFPAVPREQNVLAIYAQMNSNSKRATELDGIPFFTVVPIPRPGEDWPTRQRAVAIIVDRAPALKLLHEAIAKGGKANFQQIASLNPHARLTVESNVQATAYYLALETLLAGHNKDIAAMVKGLRGLDTLGCAFDAPCLPMQQSVGLSIDSLLRRNLEAVLGRIDIPTSDLQFLQRSLRSRDYKNRLWLAYCTMRAIELQHFEDLDNSELQPNKLQKTIWTFTGRQSVEPFLRNMREIIDALKKEWPEALAASKRVFERIPKAQVNQPTLFGMNDILPPDAEQVVWGLGKATRFGIDWHIQQAAYHTGMNRAADTAIAAELFRRSKNQLPTTLDELVPTFLPSVPIDPFTGKALVYRLIADGYEILVSVPPLEAGEAPRPFSNPTKFMVRYPTVSAQKK